MVDPNPARGMPLPLQRYWLTGKGAAKIRWRMPHDFDRCVRQLRKYFPKNPQGLCNILHQKAVGAPPGKGHPGSHSMTDFAVFSSGLQVADRDSLVAAQELLDMQPHLGHVWAGPIASIGVPTDEPKRKRIFEPGALRHRVLPLPFAWREVDAPGHEGAVTVGRMLGITYGPDHMGQEYAWAWGDWLDETIIPETKKARHLMEMGVVGGSVDPGGPIKVRVDPESGTEYYMEFTIGRVTTVPIAAYAATRLYSFAEGMDWPEDDPDMEGNYEADDSDCGCKDGYTTVLDPEETFAVNSSGWRGLPLAARDAVFDNDDAVKRIAAWAQVSAEGADVDKLRRAFMWYDTSQPPTLTTSYRLPVGDVINGNLTLIYHAIYAAAALLSGAHGGLPGVPDEDRSELRNTISAIYPEMAKEFNDSSIRAPWDRSAAEGVQMSMDDEFAATEPYGDVKYADPGYRDSKKRYPIDTPAHIRAAWAYINQADNAKFYSSEQLATIKGRIKAAAKKAGIDISDEAAMSNYPTEPPSAWFSDPGLRGKTPLTVNPDGRVFGHIAAWGECHRDFAGRECVLAPRSRKGYEPFHLGSVYTAEGETVRVGKIVMDTRHADIGLGYTAAAIHYDNTGDEVAVVRAGEDQYGIWVAGAVVPEATPAKAAKLRRSPISGDWRRVDGNLELTAALAVNVPAFPVYAMEDDEQISLVATSTPEPPTGIEPNMHLSFDMDQLADRVATRVMELEADQEARQERQQRLQDLLEDEDIYRQREVEARFSALVASAQPLPPTSSAPMVQSPAAAPGAPAPAPGAGAPGQEQAPAQVGSWPPDDESLLALQMDARFSILDEPAGGDTAGADTNSETPAGPKAPAPATTQAPPVKE
jgi:hypothetical protein